MRRKNRLRYALLGVAGLVVLAGAYLAVTAWTVRGALADARADASRVEPQLRDGDVAGAMTALDSFGRHAARAESRSSGPVWWAAGKLPVVGDDVRAVRTLAVAADAIARDGVRPVADLVERVESGELSPRGGRIPVDAIEDAQPDVRRAAATFDAQQRAVAGLDPDGLVGPVADARDEVADVLDRVAPVVGGVDRAVRLLPRFLGADGPRTYLLVLQNNAEVRSTGGFPGSTFLLRTEDGVVTLGDSYAGNKYPHLDQPVLPLRDDEQALFPPRVGTWFVDAPKIPDFPRTAQLLAAHAEERTGRPLDGVLATDPVTLSFLMAATGPLDIDGVRLDSGNVVEELLVGTYRRLEDPAAQDVFFEQTGSRVFEALTTTDDVAGLARGIARSAQERRLLMWFPDPTDEDAIAGTAVAGGLPVQGGRPEVGVYVNDATGTTGSKLSYYLDAALQVRARCAPGGAAALSATATFRSTVPGDPADLPRYVTGGDPDVPLGTEGLQLYLLGPTGGSLRSVTLDGQPLALTPTTYAGRPAVRVDLTLPAGGSRSLAWTMRAGTGQSGAPEVAMTPGARPGTPRVSVAGDC